MPGNLRILIVEDVPTDAELMEYELQNAGITFISRRVETKEAYLSELSSFSPDVILSDYSLPAFDGGTALRIAQDRIPDRPFIFVTGALGEELAIELLKQGATDYVLKNRLSRLPIAVSRALREVQERKEREQAQATLRQTEELLRKVATAMEQAAEGVMITDIEGKVEYVNPAFTQISGYADGDITGRQYTILRSGNHAQRFYDAIWHTLKAGKVWKGRLVRKRKDGSVYDAEETISPVKDSSGAVVNYVFVSRDITEQIQLEEQLRQAHKMEAIGTLTGGIAHDFNNILAAILGFAEMTLDDVPQGSPLQRNLQHILTSSLRGRDLIRQLLTFSRKTDYERKALSLSPLVKETAKLLRASLPATIEIGINTISSSDTILANPTEVQQIVMNLCTNAAYAMRENGGRLNITIADIDVVSGSLVEAGLSPGAHVEFTVQDTGTGMDGEVMKRIFEPFFTTKAIGQGTGMGLAMVYGIVEGLHGKITVDSALGTGSTFRILLPKVKTDASFEELKAVEIPKGKECILFIDDEEDLAELGKAMLEKLGYRVTAMTDSREAYKVFAENPFRFDLVFTDQTMPTMTGLHLAKKLLKIRSDMPIILCTGYSDSVSSETAKANGIKGFLMKPFAKREVAQAVRRVLGNRTEH